MPRKKGQPLFPWTPEQISFGMKLWDEGYGGSRIAMAMNKSFAGVPGTPLSRSAVIGKLFRHGARRGVSNNPTNYIDRRSTPKGQSAHRKPRPVGQSPLSGASDDARRAPAQDAMEEALEPTSVVNISDAMTLDDIRKLAPLSRNGVAVTVETLETDDCRFPIGDPKRRGFGFCARPRGEGPYCCAHSRLVGDAAANAAVKRSATIADPRAFRFMRKKA